MNHVKVVISSKTIILTLAILFLLVILYQIKDVLLLLFAAFIISSALFPTVDWLSRKMSRPLAVSVIFAVGIAVILLLFIPFFMVLTQQAQEFVIYLPSYLQALNNQIDTWHATSSLAKFIPEYDDIISNFAQYGESIVSKSINITLNLVTAFLAAFTLATLVLFILLDKETLKSGFLQFFPENIRGKTERILSTISKRVGGYVRGQLFVMLVIGIVTGITLWFIGIPYAFLLGMVAGILEIVPIIGPILSAVPAVLIAFAINPFLALAVVIAYLVIQRVENMISPFIYGKFLDMPPLVIIIALLIAASTLGVAGVILSPAIAAAIFVIIQELYLKKINGSNETLVESQD